MTHGTVVHLEPGHHIAGRAAHEIVAAQLRGEARSGDDSPRTVVRSVAEEIEDLGLLPDVAERERRYGVAEPSPATILSRRASA